MKISYAITVCNEFKEIQHLLGFLLENKIQEDEIVVLFDSNNGTKEVEKYLKVASTSGKFTWFSYEFDSHFANMKNRLTEECSGDYIFQIDADEVPNKTLINHLPEVLELNNVEVLRVSRVNTVEGLTKEHIDKWGWIVSDSGKVNWPDPQWRIYKNDPKIRWKNKVHEVLDGYTTKADLPYLEEWALYHHKEIEKQEKQNKFYNTI
jgi:GT2 family glycosyltransferase